MALIENGANVDCPNAKRLVRYLRLRNLLQHFVVCQLYHVCIAIALFKDGKLVHMIERHQIEGRPAQAIAQHLIAAFNEHCN